MKKLLNIIKNIAVCCVVIVAVSMMIFTVVSVNTFDRNDRSIFGYKLYIVNSDSMSKTDFDAGDLIFVKNISNPDELNEGDIITYISQDTESFGETVTHKIRRATVDTEGNKGFVTYGTTTDVDDAIIVTYPFIMGKYKSHIPRVGTFFNFLKTPQGYIVCIFVPFALLIIYQGINCIILFRRYKTEQRKELEKQKADIEAQRSENAKMLAELQALKARLSETYAPTDEKTEN